MRISSILRVIALTLVVCVFALVLSTCGGSHRVAPPLQAVISLDEALAELDALATPEGVDPALFQQLKDALAKQLNAKGVSKIVSPPPTGDATRVEDLELIDNGDGTYTLTWSYT